MQRTLSHALTLVALLAWPGSTRAAERPYSLTVHAGSHDRHQSIVFFELPPEAGREFALIDETGKRHQLQVGPDGQSCLIQNSLRRRGRANYKFVTRNPALEPGGIERQVDSRPTSPGVLDVSISGRPIFRYQGVKSPLPRDGIDDIYRRGAYIHPLHSPAGTVITDDYPHNHLHHHGVWWAWTKTEFEGRKPDFWNMGEGTGTVEFKDIVHNWSGPIHGGFHSQHRFVDLKAPEPTTVLQEDWRVTAYWIGRDQKEYWVIDLVSTQQCATANALNLPEYHYGGLGFRGHSQWDGAERCFFLTSDGVTDRVKAHATRGRWCHISGLVDGKYAGVAILGHPDNYRAPQPMRVHPSEPFFNYAPQQAGDMAMTAGQPYISRYRFIVHDGPPIPARIEQFWNDFAEPATVEVQFSPN